MPQKENPAQIYRDIIYRISKQMDSLNAQLILDLFERYMEALPDEYTTARTYMRDRLADITKMMNQDIFTAAKARELFSTLVSDWDHNKIGSALADLGNGYLNKTHANPVIRKRMEEIQRLVSYPNDPSLSNNIIHRKIRIRLKNQHRWVFSANRLTRLCFTKPRTPTTRSRLQRHQPTQHQKPDPNVDEIKNRMVDPPAKIIGTRMAVTRVTTKTKTRTVTRITTPATIRLVTATTRKLATTLMLTTIPEEVGALARNRTDKYFSISKYFFMECTEYYRRKTKTGSETGQQKTERSGLG